MGIEFYINCDIVDFDPVDQSSAPHRDFESTQPDTQTSTFQSDEERPDCSKLANLSFTNITMAQTLEANGILAAVLSLPTSATNATDSITTRLNHASIDDSASNFISMNTPQPNYLVSLPAATTSTTSGDTPLDSDTFPSLHVMQGTTVQAPGLKVRSKRTGLNVRVPAVAMISGSKNNIRGPQCAVM